MDERTTVRGGAWVLAMPLLAVVATMAVAILAVVVVAGSDDGAGAPAAGEPMVLEVELGDLYVKPASVEVPVGTELVVRVTNVGAMQHDLQLNGTTGTDLIVPGAARR